jgi:endonuclease I
MELRTEIIRETNGLVGQELKTKLYEMFSPLHLKDFNRLSYDKARKVLYSEIAIVDIYGGHELENIDSKKVNCEHIWPQSFFKKKYPMKSDLNHCFASQYKLNTHRSNKKFDEIDDDEAQFLDENGKPLEPDDSDLSNDEEISDEEDLDVTNLSEKSNYNNTFEPRDVSKGNVARAIAYFNTMYPKYDMNKVIDVPVLLTWHHQDPVDEGERKRVDVIYKYQNNVNPFIVCPELVSRIYLEL